MFLIIFTSNCSRNDAAGEKATLLRKRRSLEADINLAEIEDEVENDIKAKLMNKQE